MNNAPALFDTSTVIVGASGSGKTVTAKVDVERLLAQRRQVTVIDPTGVWWGLRSNAAGDGPGVDLPIFGGAHGDVPIRADQGGAIARVVLEQRVSAIVDLSAMPTSRDWRQFMAGFVAELRAGVRGNFHLVVDEADEFAAERPADDIGFQLREDLVWVAKRGRAQGFVPTWITQRTAEIAKAVISQAQTIVAHQLIAPSDRKAIDDYLKGNGTPDARAEVMGSLAELAVGERWIYSPRLRILERGRTPPLTTFDSSRTPAPGERVEQPRALAELDLTAIRAALAPIVVEAEQPDSADTIPTDPADAYAKGGVVGTMLVERDARITAQQARITELEAENAKVRSQFDQLARLTGQAVTMTEQLQAQVRELTELLRDDPADHRVQLKQATDDVAQVIAVAKTRKGATIRVGGPPAPSLPRVDRDQRALAGLVAAYPLGLTEAAWAQRTGYARKGGAWQERKRRYVAAGLIEQRDGRWYVTPAGVEQVGDAVPVLPPPGAALVRFWADRLGGAAGRILKLLADVHPKALTRDAIAAELGMAKGGGAFTGAIGALKTAELVSEASKRIAVASGIMGDD